MKFIKSEELELVIRHFGTEWALKNIGRWRIAPGFSVADWVWFRDLFK